VIGRDFVPETAGIDTENEEANSMTWLEWTLGIILLSIYITCLFTVCGLTFQKGRTVLGIAGIFFPILWLIGAILPARAGSRFDIRQRTVQRNEMLQITQ
jgi:hypothetical protein